MIKKLGFILLLLNTYVLVAQKQPQNYFQPYPIDLRTATSSYNNSYIGEQITVETIENYLINTLQNLKNKSVSIRLITEKNSLTGKHFLFQQLINNIPVYLAEIKVNCNNKGFITSIIDNSFSVDLLVPDQNNKRSTTDESDVYFFDGKALIPAKKTQRENILEIISKTSNSVIYNKDLNLYFKDTTALGTVFMPDPLTTAGVEYGGLYVDSNDIDLDVLNQQIDTVVLELTFDENTDTFLLENSYVKITDHSFPYIAAAKTVTDTFFYTRSESGFEDVNVFYHITEFNKYLQSLGYTNLMNYQIHIDPHGLNGQDNSTFMSSFNPPRISFGEGGVDDAEDTDVVIHEYTHAIMYDATGQNPSGTERETLDEANADILASSYSRVISEYRWDEVYTWDGHNEFWSGRLTSGNKHYPEDLENNKYLDTDIWAAAIMEIWGKLGRETTDKLLIESSYSYSTGMTLRDAATLFMEADTALNGGANTWDICTTMLFRGLLSECLVGISDEVTYDDKIALWNTDNFSNGIDDAYLYSVDSIDIQLDFYDLRGRLVRSEQHTNTERVVIPTLEFKTGIYIVKTKYDNKEKTFKLVKH